MKHRTLVSGNHAVAGVIEALLLVALVAVILSTIQLLYIPEIMEQREADHMDEVANQFSFLKSVIDLHAATEKDVPITAPLTLGSRELPYFVTAAAYGELIVYDKEYKDIYKISVLSGSEIVPLTSIYYKAHNRYYPENKPGQEYILEGGALILKQQDGENMLIDPSITISNKSGDITLEWELPIFIGLPGKNATSGYKSCYIRTNYSRSDPWEEDTTDINGILIYTDYPEAWNKSFNILLGSLNESKMICKAEPPNQPDHVQIRKEGGGIIFRYKRTYIYVQVSPGWIDNN